MTVRFIIVKMNTLLRAAQQILCRKLLVVHVIAAAERFSSKSEIMKKIAFETLRYFLNPNWRSRDWVLTRVSSVALLQQCNSCHVNRFMIFGEFSRPSQR